MNDMNEINATDTGSTKIAEKLKLSRVWLIVIIVVVVLALAVGAYFGFRFYQARHKSTSESPADTSATATTTTATTATTTSVNDIKTQIDSTNVDQVKTTLTGLKNSLSMFNR